MISLCTFLCSLMLFSQLSSHLVTATVPSTKAEDSIAEQDGLAMILEDEPAMAEPAVMPPVYRRSQLPDNSIRDGGRRSKVIVVSDMRLKGIRGLNQAFFRSPHLLTDQIMANVPAQHSLGIDRRNADLDMLRCMVGRVYRPCWEMED